jgi:hypothetical protein
MAQISVWREIGRMLGYYNQPAIPPSIEEQLKSMSDEQLLALI